MKEYELCAECERKDDTRNFCETCKTKLCSECTRTRVEGETLCHACLDRGVDWVATAREDIKTLGFIRKTTLPHLTSVQTAECLAEAKANGVPLHVPHDDMVPEVDVISRVRNPLIKSIEDVTDELHNLGKTDPKTGAARANKRAAFRNKTTPKLDAARAGALHRDAPKQSLAEYAHETDKALHKHADRDMVVYEKDLIKGQKALNECTVQFKQAEQDEVLLLKRLRDLEELKDLLASRRKTLVRKVRAAKSAIRILEDGEEDMNDD